MARWTLALTLLLLPLILVSAAALGDPDRGDAHRRKLIAVIGKVKSFRVLGSVERIKSRSFISPRSAPYTGEFEAWSPGKHELVIVSPSALPGFEVYRSADDDLVRVTYEEDSPSLGELRNDLGALLDSSRLAKWLKKAKLTATRDAGTGIIRFHGTAPRRLVPAKARGPMGLMRNKILRVEVSLELTAKGKLGKAEFRVVRADPLAALIPGGLPNDPGGLLGPLPDGKDKEGTTSVYRLKWVPGDPSRRAREFYDTALRLLEEEQ